MNGYVRRARVHALEVHDGQRLAKRFGTRFRRQAYPRPLAQTLMTQEFRSVLKIRDVLRYARPYSPALPTIDGVRNYFHITHYPGHKLPLLEKGINPLARINAPDGERVPAILIRSSPHRFGSGGTPWQDFFDPDNGHILYFGDNKEAGKDPAHAPGNSRLIAAGRIQNALEATLRKNSTPVIFFQAVRQGLKAKGHVRFQGFGIVRSITLVTQFHRKKNQSFSNYAFDCVVLSMASEAEEFDWSWINSRRNTQLTLSETLTKAPLAWREWTQHGSRVIDRCRRRVSKLLTVPASEQRPEASSKELRVLRQIYTFYSKRPARFEGLAAVVTERILSASGGQYQQGWITPASSDGGSDFVGRLDIGSDFSRAKLIVLGQAKCEHPNSPTAGRDIARTVARLKRGWLGVYVTTGYFSEAVQREVIEDSYPILLIHGLRLAREIMKTHHELGYKDIPSFLAAVDAEYENRIQIRRPEEILVL